MKEIPAPIELTLPPANITIDEVRAIYDLLGEFADEVELASEHFELTNPEDLSNHPAPRRYLDDIVLTGYFSGRRHSCQVFLDAKPSVLMDARLLVDHPQAKDLPERIKSIVEPKASRIRSLLSGRHLGVALSFMTGVLLAMVLLVIIAILKSRPQFALPAMGLVSAIYFIYINRLPAISGGIKTYITSTD